MGVMRKVVLVLVSAASAVAMGAAPGASADPGAGAGVPGRNAAAVEADLAHHGHVSLSGGHLVVLLGSENHGPSGLADATVRLDFSAPVAAGQALPPTCLWGGDRTVLCRTGLLRPIGRGSELTLDLRTTGRPDEIVVRIDTAWNGGADDLNLENHRHRVLAPDTGDRYAF
ncbi:hypothetical protein ACIOHE_29670 [Streptomyces sp. NPDC087851]|uniref:hypothetical protein n=1 Tax=Streptomyces sp. NPDC087851 TaxID=3365810 RepID=UPI00381299CB